MFLLFVLPLLITVLRREAHLRVWPYSHVPVWPHRVHPSGIPFALLLQFLRGTHCGHTYLADPYKFIWCWWGNWHECIDFLASVGVSVQGLVGYTCQGCIWSDGLVCAVEQHLLRRLGIPSVGISVHHIQRAQVHLLPHAYCKHQSSFKLWIMPMWLCQTKYLWTLGLYVRFMVYYRLFG